MDGLLAHCELDAAIFMLKEITDLPECKLDTQGFTDKYSPQVFVCVQSIIKCKNKLGKSSKKDKVLLNQVLERLRKYIVTVDRDEQIKILKYVQPD